MLTKTNTETTLGPHEKTPTKQPYTFWVTEIVNPCLRSAFLHKKMRKPPSPETLENYRLGKLLESRWVESLRRRTDITILRSNVPCRHINQFFEIHGKADLLLQQERGTIEVYEVKTAKGGGHCLDNPYSDHVNQLQFYLNAIGVEWGVLNYIDKDVFLKSNRLVDRKFPIKRDEGTYGSFLDRSRELFNSLLIDKTPQKERCWKCGQYCLYNQECNLQ